jgi:hypothetical protein
MLTACGPIAPVPNAMYCAGDRTIYLVPQFLQDQEQQFGDFAPIAILSHEWGHHIQALLGIIGTGPPNKTSELQADCLMGAFTRYADDQALLDYGDFMEELNAAEEAGDDTFLPEDAPGAHGLPEERIKALTKGYGGGPATGCDLPLSGGQVVNQSVSTTDTTSASSVGSIGTTSTQSPAPELIRYLPATPPLMHAPCFRVEDEGDLTLNQVLSRFDNSADAAARLQTWGWQASAFRTFACDGPPRGEAGWIEIDLHLFADAASAQEAVDYFAAARAAGTTLLPGSPPAIGDHAAVLSGPATNGNEFTLYASQGPLLIRVTGVSPSGIPFADVLKVAQSILATQPGTLSSGPAPNAPTTASTAPAYAYLPSSPAVNYATCFSVIDDGTYANSDIRFALGKTGMSAPDIDALGWQDGAYRVFTCAAPPPGRATQLDVVIHRFRDATAAQQVLPFMRGSYVPAASEVRHCAAASLVVCVLGRSLTGSPLSDVDFVLQQILGSAA